MKSVLFLSLLLITSQFAVVEKALASEPERHENKAADLDKEILKYQFDALLCAASPIVAKIPGSSHVLEASKCALVAGLGVTEIVRSLTECAHMRHSQNDRDFLGCLKSGSSYFASNKEALACLLGNSLEKSGKKMLHHLGIVGDIVTCSLTVAQGATLLVDTTKAANAARQEARNSAATLAQTIASLKGGRLYNMGFYRGCFNVTNVYPGDENRCVHLCESQKQMGRGALAGVLNAEQQAHTLRACQSGCKATEAVPNSWIYTLFVSSEPGVERKGCEAVVSKVKHTLEGVTQTNFRVLPLPGVNEGKSEQRLGAFLAWKLRITAALDAIEQQWKNVRKTPGGLAKTEDIVALGNSDTAEAKLISSVFGNKDLGVYAFASHQTELPILAAYLDSTQTGEVDGWISLSDILAFKEEINRYYYGG
mgnify:CR=1 FL=1